MFLWYCSQAQKKTYSLWHSCFIVLELKRFLDVRYTKEEKTLSEIEQKFVEIEECPKPPKKRKLKSSRKKNVPEPDAMVALAAQLQVDHFQQVSKFAWAFIKA